MQKPVIIEIIPVQGSREAQNDMCAYAGITKLTVDLLIFGMSLPLITLPSKCLENGADCNREAQPAAVSRGPLLQGNTLLRALQTILVEAPQTHSVLSRALP